MSAKHTPGRWEFHKSDWGDLTIVTDDLEARANGNEEDFLILASINMDPPTHVSAEEAEANARLISAAPDMLEALEKMVAGFDQYMSAVREVHFITQKQPTGFAEARAAIAKARGDS